MLMSNSNNFNSNNFNTVNTNSYSDILPKQFLNYIDYELSCFEKITNKKFFFNLLKNDKFELNVYESKEDDNKSKYQIIYRANNLYQFIKRLLMIREYLIKYFDNQRSKKIILYNNQKERKFVFFYCLLYDLSIFCA